MAGVLTRLVRPLLVAFGLAVRIPAGARVGERVWLGRGVWLDPSHGRHISIGDDVTLSQRVRVLCHDASSYRRIGMTWVAPVVIGDRAFVGASAIVLPGVTIGEDAVVGAGAVVTHDVPPRAVVAGVPAQVIGDVDSLDAARLARVEEGARVFDAAAYSGLGLDAARAAQLDAAAGGTQRGYFLAGSDGAVVERLDRG